MLCASTFSTDQCKCTNKYQFIHIILTNKIFSYPVVFICFGCFWAEYRRALLLLNEAIRLDYDVLFTMDFYSNTQISRHFKQFCL